MEAELDNKSDNVIQLKKDTNLLRLNIRDDKGNDTGNYLEFNLARIDLFEIYQKLIDKDKLNRENLNRKLLIIDKKQDHQGKKFLTYKQEEQYKAYKDFLNDEIEVYNMFLGENGVQKLLNGRDMTWFTLNEIDDIINQVILPKLEINAKDIKKEIMSKYSNNNSQKADDVIE